jgi:DNA polymerase-1
MAVKKLFLLDALALIYRAHFAFSKNPRITSKGLNTSAVFGFTNTLLEVIQKEKPTHIAVAFDNAVPTFRHIEFPAYKAQRQEQPEDITVAIPLTKALLRALNIPVLELDGYEADDIIGTFAKIAAEKDFITYMMTPDKDYGQLVAHNIFLYKPAFMGNGVEIMGVNEVCEKWGIDNVSQITDLLGLMGDAVDNIPGIPGVGEKTAVKFIKEFGNIENLIANADTLKGKMRENVLAFAEQGLLSKRLATIDTKVPLPFNEAELVLQSPDREALQPILAELEFRTLAKRILGEETPVAVTGKLAAVSKKAISNEATGQLDLFDTPAPATETKTLSPTEEIQEDNEAPQEKTLQNIQTTLHSYFLVDTPALCKDLAGFLSLQQEFCFDTETTSVSAFEAELVGISFAYLKGEAFYVPVPANRQEAQNIVEIFREVFENETITKIGQNIKYDMMVLKNYGVNLKGKYFDTMLAHYLIEPDMRHNMDVLAENYLNYSPISIEKLIGKKGATQGNMRDVAVEIVKEYAAEDADITLQLKHALMPEIQDEAIKKLLEQVENPLVEVLADMERNGVKIDTAALLAFSKDLEKEIAEAERIACEKAGATFNPSAGYYQIDEKEFKLNSPKQLGEVLFEKLKLIDKPKKTKTGQYATDEETLIKLAADHEIVRYILDFRQLQKLKSTYVDALPTLISPKDGLIHTSYNQAVAATGRLSSNNPNLQNIPIRTDRGKEIRKAFIPRSSEYVLMSADYSQVELRIMAAFSKDATMIEAFRAGKDIHAATAAKIYKVNIEEVTSDMRRKAKTANFGIIYGISAHGLAQRLNIPRGEAKEIIDTYFEEFKAVKNYMDSVINQAREVGYVETIMGRRRYLRDIQSQNATLRGYAERNAINAPIQGSAADLIKKAMIDIHHWMRTAKVRSLMTMQVHDELVFDVHRSEIELMREHIPRLMENALSIGVPLTAEVGIGENWLEAH